MILNVGTETVFRHDHCKHFQKVNLSRFGGQRSVDAITGLHRPQEAFSEVKVHAGTTQVDFEVDRPPPADSPPGDFLITMVRKQ